MDDVRGRLLDVGIKLKSIQAGRNEKIVCPKCEGGRTKETSLSVTIDRDGMGATAVCHRGTCGWKHGFRVGSDPIPPAERRQFQRPVEHAPDVETQRPDWLFDFFFARNIGSKAVADFGVYAVTRRFKDPIGQTPTIVFPYRHGGEVVNRKYRPHPAKTPQLQEPGALPTLFNVDALGADPAEIVFVEGEPDVMAMHECGIRNAVSLKDGAPAEVSPEEEMGGKRFEALSTHAALLEKAKRIVLAGDMDAPGMALREELARRLGRHRCYLVTWPEGCKDACDVLQRHGPDAVMIAVQQAEPYPIEGIQTVTADRLLGLRHGRRPPVLTTGTRALDDVLKLPGEGRLIVVTGVPGHGKTSLVTFLAVHLMAHHDRRFVIFSPEMQPWDEYAAHCAAVRMGKPFWPTGGRECMTDGEIIAASQWLAPRLKVLVSDAEEDAPTLEWWMERTRASVLRDGTTDAVIDPWNEVEHAQGDLTETQYIGRSLQRLKGFANRHGVNVWIAAHPRIQRPAKPGERIPAPGLYEISGSSHWANKTDLGITVHTPGELTEVHIMKSRFKRWGRRGEKALLGFDADTGVYSSPDDAAADQQANWTERAFQ